MLTCGRQATWLIPYLAGLAVISWLGSFGGGLGVLTFGWDLLCLALLSLAVMAMAVAVRLPDAAVQVYLAQEQALDTEA